MKDKIVMALLGLVFGIGAVSFIEGTPKQQARHEVDRCTEIARIMMSRAQQRPPELVDDRTILGYTLECLKTR